MNQRSKEEIFEKIGVSPTDVTYRTEHAKLEILIDIRDNLQDLTDRISHDIQWNTEALYNIMRQMH